MGFNKFWTLSCIIGIELKLILYLNPFFHILHLSTVNYDMNECNNLTNFLNLLSYHYVKKSRILSVRQVVSDVTSGLGVFFVFNQISIIIFDSKNFK